MVVHVDVVDTIIMQLPTLIVMNSYWQWPAINWRSKIQRYAAMVSNWQVASTNAMLWLAKHDGTGKV